MQEIEDILFKITGLNLTAIVFIFLVTLIGWYISQNAKNTIPRVIFAVVGIYLIIVDDFFLRYLGVGFILAHIFFLYYVFKWQYFIFKEVGANGYYILLTFYYKFVNFFIWLNSLFYAIGVYIKTKSYSNAKQNYNDENNEQESEFDYSKYEKAKENFEQEYKEQKEEIKDKTNDEYAQFYSSSYYIVLGVNQSDDFETIKKAYRTLVRLHHPDINQDRIEEATIITQKINQAYAYLSKNHK